MADAARKRKICIGGDCQCRYGDQWYDAHMVSHVGTDGDSDYFRIHFKGEHARYDGDYARADLRPMPVGDEEPAEVPAAKRVRTDAAAEPTEPAAAEPTEPAAATSAPIEIDEPVAAAAAAAAAALPSAAPQRSAPLPQPAAVVTGAKFPRPRGPAPKTDDGARATWDSDRGEWTGVTQQKAAQQKAAERDWPIGAHVEDADDSTVRGVISSSPRARARILRCFEHAVLCTGCDKPACARMKNHFIHRHETAGQCRCTVCRGIETCVVLHARRCRSPTCPISACARRRLQDAQAAAAGRLQDAQALLPPPAGRWEYRCSKCGQPKKGHVCPYD